jgi:hypothetical protein
MSFTLNPLQRTEIAVEKLKLDDDEAIGSKIITPFPLVEENNSRKEIVITKSNPRDWMVVETIEKWRKINPEILEGRENVDSKPTFTKDGFIKI